MCVRRKGRKKYQIEGQLAFKKPTGVSDAVNKLEHRLSMQPDDGEERKMRHGDRRNKGCGSVKGDQVSTSCTDSNWSSRMRL